MTCIIYIYICIQVFIYIACVLYIEIYNRRYGTRFKMSMDGCRDYTYVVCALILFHYAVCVCCGTLYAISRCLHALYSLCSYCILVSRSPSQHSSHTLKRIGYLVIKVTVYIENLHSTRPIHIKFVYFYCNLFEFINVSFINIKNRSTI